MLHTIENDILRVVVSTKGAEIQSVVRKADNHEVLWQGDPAFWDGRSPILFPAVGGLWNGVYTWQGKTYTMPKHGFVSDVEWEVVDHEAGRITLATGETPETLAAFPFHFRLLITYVVTEHTLEAHYDVVNNEEETMMPYQVGGHPAIALPDYAADREVVGYIRPLDKNGECIKAQALSVVRAGAQGCWSRERHAVPATDDGLIPVSVATFANEALIFDHQQVAGGEILDLERRVLATVRSKSPVWLFWQMQDLLCPYVCAEPWFGLCDLQGESVDLIERPYCQCAAPGSVRGGVLWRLTVPEEA